jgi:hypothetical protein
VIRSKWTAGQVRVEPKRKLAVISGMSVYKELAPRSERNASIPQRGFTLILAIIDSSCAGLTRASILKNPSIFRTMDCRVKPGNDDEESLDA